MNPKTMPWVIPEYCEGCGSCIASCRKGCLSLFATEKPEIYIVWTDKPEDCTGCGRCSEGCVMGGITMTAYREKAIERFHQYIANGKVRALREA
jgi:Na+-translocating ferredoxin:NAD+ oxidoreductase RNF subunit RnfB